MKHVIPILLIFLFISCSNEKELEGYWHGEFKSDGRRSPALIKFENGSFIDFFGLSNDAIAYKRIGNKIVLEDMVFNDNQHEFRIELNNNKLSTWDSNNNLIISLKKRSEDNFIYDYLNDKSLIIDLPLGRGVENKFGQLNQLKWPLYLTYKNDNLVANFLDTTVIVNSNYHKLLRKKKVSFKENESSLFSNRIALIADKSVRVSDIDLLREQLRILGFSKIQYHLKSESYDKVNILTSRLRELNEKEFNEFNTKENPLPPSPTSFIDHIPSFTGELMIVNIDGNILTANDSVVSLNKFGEFIQPKILSNRELAIFYYISKNSTYENFIQFNEIVYNTYYDVRDDYLMKKYHLKFRSNYNSRREEIIEAKKKYPLIFWQMDSLEYNKIKYNL